ncbi:MAG: C-GCAxxG-C-C family protein [Bacteroidales bacterium]|nr:C-GCAxxG-C-C family protein [Bacteroidales bacterium]
MNRKEKALKLYANGFNCSQVIIASFADLLDLNEEKAILMASGFGGGMGKMQNTCGAITGSYMVIGFLRGKFVEENKVSNEESGILVREFTKRFTEIHKSTNCKALIKFDIGTKEGMEEAVKAEVFKKKCSSYIITAIEILEDILSLPNTIIKK